MYAGCPPTKKIFDRLTLATQKNPGLVWTFADELDVTLELANQIGWGFKGRGHRGKN